MADTAYDADPLRQAIVAKGAIAGALKYPLDKHLYAQRHLVECCFSKLKQFRRVATRFEKTARNYRAVVTLAAIILWMRSVSTPPRARWTGRGQLGNGAASPCIAVRGRSQSSAPAQFVLVKQ